jgi:DNA repair photolyase
MKRFTGHRETWGDFLDVKINAPNLLEREIKRKRVGRVWISGVCDPYQPIERTYELTRKCLRILLGDGWPVTLQTKSPLILRDRNLLIGREEVKVVVTITTADEEIRRIFEPNTPQIKERIKTVKQLSLAGVNTCAMIAPILPKAEDLIAQLRGKVDYVLLDRMNYHYSNWVYRKYKLEPAMNVSFFAKKKVLLTTILKQEGIPYEVLY